MAQTFQELQDRLTELSKEVDIHLEEHFGESYPLHPMRLPQGKAANPAADGLFATTITFDLGYGTKTGRGYVVKIDVRTLETVRNEDREKFMASAYDFLRERIPVKFPERKLMAVIEGRSIKIVGDFTVSHQV